MTKKLYGRVNVEPSPYGYDLFLSVGNGRERYALREQDFYALKQDIENIVLEKIKTMSSVESLWPEELFSLPLTIKEKEEKSPYTVFKNAGEELSRKTDKLITYRLHKTKHEYGNPGSVCIQLFLVCGPGIEFKLLESNYSLDSSGYPMTLNASTKGSSQTTITIKDYDELINALRALFSNEETLRVIANLKTNAKFLEESD